MFDDDQQLFAAPARPSDKKGKQNKTPPIKKTPKQKATDNKCFAMTCTFKKKAGGRFCVQDHHQRDFDAMKYQVERDGEMKTFDAIFAGPVKAEQALDDFRRDNPTGALRKKKLDWAALKRRHGVTTSVIVRTPETLMDFTDYTYEWMRKRFLNREPAKEEMVVIKQSWKALVASNPANCTGEGVDMKIWIESNLQRFRDKTKYCDQSVEESSKAVKVT